MKKPVILLFACFFLTGCNRSPGVNVRTEADAIRKIHDQWEDAIKTKDVDKYMSFFAPGAVEMNANSPACVGLPSIRKSLETWFSDTTSFPDTFESTIDTLEISFAGDLAYMRGHQKLNIGTAGGIIEVTDKWITIFRKINGRWKAIVDIWNSDMAL
jgi:ketosteroid isomerase-like protein